MKMVECQNCRKENHKKFCYNCDTEIEGEYFKCRVCGDKYLNHFCSSEDITLCKWCGNEEAEE